MNANVFARAGLLLSLGIGLAAVAGCGTPVDGGPDMAYLTSAPTNPADLPNHATDNLLPLTTGNYWQVKSQSDGKLAHDTLTVAGDVTPPGGVLSVEINMTRDGKPWRQEFYSHGDGSGLFITAMKDETSPLMVFSSPAPLYHYGFKEGDEVNWQGTVELDQKKYPASQVSRVSGIEKLATKAGKFTVCRIDTIASIMIDGHSVRFPSVRWFAPGVGFVRRSFADKGRPAISEVEQFNVR